MGSEPNGDPHWWSEQRFTHPPLQEYWMEYYWYVPTNFFHRDGPSSDNNKLYAWWGPNGYSAPGAGCYQSWPTTPASNEDGVNCGRYGPTDTSLQYPPGSGPLVQAAMLGTWQRSRVHLRLSDVGSSNGVERLWIGDNLILDVTGDNNSAGTTQANVYDSGYLMGYDNSGYDELTVFYIDDVKFYGSSPGW